MGNAGTMIEAAERALEGVTGAAVRLTVTRAFTSPHELVRCDVATTGKLPATVIVKRITTTDFTTATGGVSGRHRNERQVLGHLSGLEVASPPWPRLVAGGADLLVLEDLGDHPTALAVLEAGDGDAAERCLAAMGAALRRIHDAGRGYAPPAPPRSDSTFDARAACAELEASAADIGLAMPAGFWDDLAELENRIHGAGPHRTMIHADAGPQNVLWDGAAARVVDFEFAASGHALLDVVSARLGFPHSAQAATVPPAAAALVEASYRIDDDEALTDACAHWALVRWAALHARLFRGGEADATMQSQAFTVYRRFVATAGTTGHRLPIADAVDRYTVALQRRFPGLGEMPPFPAL